MKLVRYGRPGKEKPGMVDADGVLRDLSGVVADIGPEQLSPRGLARLAKLKADRLPAVRGRPRMGVPFSGATKFVAIGLNYSDHAAETGNPVPKEPVVFHKTLSSMQGATDEIMLPKGSVKTDWEVELGIVIGTRARHVTRKAALDHVAGYVVVNDVSEREWQMEHGPTWDKGKGFDTFGPVGPWLVTRDEVPNPQRLSMWLDVNGEPRQRGSTRTMVFDCATLIACVSRLMTLNPGDIITTGTPPGVGTGMKPPQFLKPGDVVSLGIEGLGEQRSPVVKFRL
ncbi:fumarylacetoacetate hydrolase family protein [Quisquiliibacterium transsilvanicum]|uniref:2-keto-4-pentenoate hydratase/2-oxohepta-3-ene-1,7-dioic acid hydratase in catechol pathway n=1 Tax=Quisquiliibacterium transsilvanicum TaxID=1549638 RepID=A0A7W8M8C4_9BURK|nr:fumarylacetoacetate hydrolase family protein [Quisquiliibacterium transsilvanicum]MBB5271663.1 2-keto-4-pentenoate hydratase/2-oxohepta-3-ene-1,7-dioic acid hydratase in catechol pathway [Quisquiliibacterium transsilvanicum]